MPDSFLTIFYLLLPCLNDLAICRELQWLPSASCTKAMRTFFLDRLWTIISFMIFLSASCCFAALQWPSNSFEFVYWVARSYEKFRFLEPTCHDAETCVAWLRKWSWVRHVHFACWWSILCARRFLWVSFQTSWTEEQIWARCCTPFGLCGGPWPTTLLAHDAILQVVHEQWDLRWLESDVGHVVEHGGSERCKGLEHRPHAGKDSYATPTEH